MLNAFFNPYPGMCSNYEMGKKRLLATAKTYKKISERIKIKTNDPEEKDSIKFFLLSQDQQGIQYTPSHYIRQYSGQDRTLIIWFLRMFDKGSRVSLKDLSICEDWELCVLNVPAPILEYALRQDGVSITISDDQDWKIEFFTFINQKNQLPNIYGQTNCSRLESWIDDWNQRNLSFKSLLENNYNFLFCAGSTNTCFPSRHEEEKLLIALKRAQENSYRIDNNLVKSFQTKYGSISELRSYGDGMRIFFTIKKSRPVIGGFYRKSMSISQNKAGEYAAKRLRDQGYMS